MQSPRTHTQFHWSSGPPICFPSWGTQVQSSGGNLCETGILLLALSRYIGDPDVIGHCGPIWGRLRPEPSQGRHADYVINPLDLKQLHSWSGSPLCLVRKLNCHQTLFGSAAISTHATAMAMHFPANAGLIFLSDELTNDRYLIDTGATLSIVPCNLNSSHLVPFSKGQMDILSPLEDSLKKLYNFKASFLLPLFCKPLLLLPFWALTFWENSRSLLLQRSAKSSLLVQQRPCPPLLHFQRPRPFCFVGLALHQFQLRFQLSCLLQWLLPSLLPYLHM